MKRSLSLLALVAVSLAATPAALSGPVGIYGIIERVALEPNDRTPERIKVWGAFAYVDGGPGGHTISAAKRGYMYFKISPMTADSASLRAVRAEWNDLKAVAGTGQAVGFGRWGYIGQFGGLSPDSRFSGLNSPPYILERMRGGGTTADLRVHSPTDTLVTPASYDTNVGVVKITETSHGAVVRVLRDALNRK